MAISCKIITVDLGVVSLEHACVYIGHGFVAKNLGGHSSGN